MAPQRNATDDVVVEQVATRQFFENKAFSESFADCLGYDTELVTEPKLKLDHSHEFVDMSVKGRGLSFKSDDYGLWDEGDADESADVVEILGDSIHSLQSTSSVSSLTSIKTGNTDSSLRLDTAADSASEVGVNPVFVFENGRAPVSCRAFESSVSSRIVQVSISLPGFRIVQSDAGEYAEFRVKMLLCGKELAIWKKFSYFEQLAEACREYSSVEVAQSWTSMFKTTPSPRKCRLSRNKINFRDTLVAWERVLVARFWGWTLSHTISVQRLMEESQLLEQFLKCILFEVPSPDILVEFFSQL
jgi:hypothetical protein